VNGGFRVGSWLVQPSLNTISHNGTSTRVEPKVMEVLVCLAQHTGDVVAKEQLLQTVWPDTFVSDDVLKRSISELRRAFEDDARESKIIETIPKRGYRLMAAVQPGNRHTASAATTNSSTAELHRPAPTKRNWRTLPLLSLVAAICVGGLLLVFNFPGAINLLGRSATQPIRSVAVLPLQNLSGDPSQDYLADGMTEELITDLSRLSSLRVISRTSVMLYRKANKPLPEIARELGVDGIIEGSVLRSGNRVRITVQLIYAPQDKNIWAQSYARDLEDVLELQSTVSNNIADEIRVRITPSEPRRAVYTSPAKLSVNLRAHEAYLQGLHHAQLAQDAVLKKDKGKAGMLEAQEAEKYFRLAIREDPNYAPPYLGIFDAWMATPLPPPNWAPRIKPMLLKALQLDDSLAEAHAALAGVLDVSTKDWPAAENEFLRALQLAPSDACAHANYGQALMEHGRPKEAMEQYELAQGLDPKNDHMAEAFYWTRQFDRAAELYRSQAEARPGDFYPHYALANIDVLTGKRQKAISEWQTMLTILEYTEMADSMGSTYKSSGYEKAVRGFARQMERASSHENNIPAWFIALIYADAGAKDQAFAWLEKASDAGDLGELGPEWDPLRSDPRFKELPRLDGLAQ
jgi:TolB-like protein/DNA-binding winged helix-turn-helix (wHTH) protein